MGDAKRIRVAPISPTDARRLVRKLHYSGTVCSGSQVHLGVFLDGRCGGAMQFGPSLDKRRMQSLVTGTAWNEFLELNRMAFADWLPRNSESRALGYAMRWLRTTYPWLKWIVSFADATQCGDGTIYRASGFVLTGLKQNTSIWQAPTGETFSRTSLTGHSQKGQQRDALAIVAAAGGTPGKHMLNSGASSMRGYRAAGWAPLAGYQLRYVYFLDTTARDRLTVPVLPFSAIADAGAQMYRGARPKDQDPARPGGAGR